MTERILRTQKHNYRISAKIHREGVEVDDLVVISRDVKNVCLGELTSAVTLMISQWCGEFINVIELESVRIELVEDDFD